jgi:hypothetical protein
MPWKDPEKRKERRREVYAEKLKSGARRNWGTIEATCPICGKDRTLSKNSWKITSLERNESGRIVKRCRSCSKKKLYSPWADSRFVIDHLSVIRRDLKVKCIGHKGGSCEKCGYSYNGSNAYAFDFHHLAPAKKDFLPASKFRKWEKVLAELEKCELLCAICHRSKHSAEY